MNIPQFTAQASLYRSSNLCRPAGPQGAKLWSGEGIAPAYYPGPATQAECQKCLKSVINDYFYCVAFTGFPLSLGHCQLQYYRDVFKCEVDVCYPKRCEGLGLFGEGDGCCDADETCVAQGDPNSRSGCCPSDQIVCAGTCCRSSCCGDICCPPGYFCCGDTCCPPGYHCRDGWICEREFIGRFPTTPPPAPPAPSDKWCILMGGEPCGRGCCPLGLECCGLKSDGSPDCKRYCPALH